MKKNILVFASTFPRWRSDPIAAKFVYELAQELSKYFHVYVLTPHAPGAEMYEEWEELKIIRFPYFLPLKSQALVDGTGMLSCVRNNKLAVIQIPFFLICQAYALCKTLIKYKINVVNSHWMIPQGFVATLLKPFLGFSHILTIHAAGLFALRRLPLGKLMANLIVNRTDAIYCVSSYNHQTLKNLVKKDVASYVLPMGIHIDYFHSDKDRERVREELGLQPGKMILYVGKLSDKKGVVYLLEAFHSIHDKVDGFLTIVGGGVLEHSLREKTKSLGIEDRVIFAGYQEKGNIKNFYAACDVVAIPSIIDSRGETEGLPVVLLEALASGKPVVASRVGGMADVIRNGLNGFLVEQKNVTALAEKIQTVLNSEPNHFSQNALESAKQYDWEKIGLDYKNVLQNIS